MTRFEQADGRDKTESDVRDLAVAEGEALAIIAPEGPDGGPRVLVRAIERAALVRFANAEVLFDEESVRSVGDRLDRLVAEEGYTRLVLDLSGVCYISGAMLGRLAALQRNLRQTRGRIRLCGLDPLVRDVLRISRLEREFDVYDDAAQALGPMSGLKLAGFESAPGGPPRPGPLTGVPALT